MTTPVAAVKAPMLQMRIPPQTGSYTEILHKALQEREHVGARELLLPNGFVHIAEDVVLAASYQAPLTIRGSADTVISGDGSFIVEGCDDVTFADLKLHYFSVDVRGPSSRVRLKRMHIDSSEVVISSDSKQPCMDWLIEDCRFTGCEVALLVQGMSNDGLVQRCTFSNCSVCAEVESDIDPNDIHGPDDCPRVTFRDCRMHLSDRQDIAFCATGTAAAPMIFSGVRIDGAGSMGHVGLCGKRFNHSLVNVWNTAGPLKIPEGLWINTKCCDGVSFVRR